MLSSGGERPVHWSLLGAGVEGCYRESPPNFDYQPPRQLPPETDLWHKKVQLFLFLCVSRFRWGAVVHGGGVTEQKKNKQTKHWQQVTRAVKQRLPRKLTGIIFLCSENKSQTKYRKSRWLLMNEPTLLYKRSPREALIRESGCATFISSIMNNCSVNFDHQRHIFIHAEQYSKHRKGKSCLVIIISNVKPIMLPSHQATTTCPKSIVLT